MGVSPQKLVGRGSTDIWLAEGFTVGSSEDNELISSPFRKLQNKKAVPGGVSLCPPYGPGFCVMDTDYQDASGDGCSHRSASLCLRSRSNRYWFCAHREPCAQLEAGSISVKPSLETQAEKAGHRGEGKEAWNWPVASPLSDTSLTASAYCWGTGASTLGSS